MNTEVLIEQLNQALPQTQCGLCSYEGCRPYAKAIATQGETIDRCPPGGLATLRALAKILQQDPEPLLADFIPRIKPPSRVFINEAECIGCTKCIQVCPVDAIIGSTKQMHTVLAAECTGCELCIAPCPMDCIVREPLIEPSYSPKKARQRHEHRQQRLAQEKRRKTQRHTEAKQEFSLIPSLAERKVAIAEAIARVNQKRKSTTL